MSWEKYEKAADKGPGSIMLKVFLLGLAAVVVLGAAGYILGWFGEAAKTAQEEFGAKAALAKYEWFIDQANMIKKMDADIALFENRVKSVEKAFQSYGEDKAKWPPHIQAQYNRERQQANEDLLAVTSQRNNLVREYNAQSGKFNWTPFQTRPDKPQTNFQEYVTR